MATTDYELVIESIRGEMRRNGKNTSIDVQSFHFGTATSRDVMGQSTGRRVYTDVTFGKLLDMSSPSLQTMLATNESITKATLNVYKAAGNEKLLYYKLTLSDAFISNYKIIGHSGQGEYGSIPRDEFTINFRKIEVEYVKQAQSGDKDGSVSFADELNRPGQ